jgi:hypothetical protein
MTRKISICTLLVAISISAASAATAAPSTDSHERAHRPTLIQVIKYKVMSAVAEAKGAIAETKGRAAMAAKAKAVMAAKAKAAMEAKAAMANRKGASMERQVPCPYYPDNDHSSSADERPSLVDGNRCR